MYDIELVNVTKEFAARGMMVKAVDDISLQIEKGEFFALLGPSGCGKTTTLRMIAGFEQPSQGQILVRGKAMQNVPPFHRPVNTVFQDYALFPHMTALQNVMFGLEMAGIGKSEARKRALESLEMVQLASAAERKPKALSGGQQQRVALARALVNNPTVLLLDEPLGALDLKLRKEMQFELKQMQQNLDITFIYVTHDQEEALTMADRIAVMNHGQVLQLGAPKEIYDAPHTRFVADFIGETNFIVGILREKESERAFVELPNGQKVGAIMDEPDTLEIGRSATIAIRPEKITMLPRQGTYKRGETSDVAVDDLLSEIKADTMSTVLSAEIKKSVYIGTDTRHIVQLSNSDTEIVIRMQNFGTRLDQEFSQGESIYLHWIDENARILRD